MMGFGAAELAAGRGMAALETAHGAMAINPLREDAYRLAMQALVSEGRNAEAQKLYRDLVTLLRQELNTGPDRKTTSLVDGLRNGMRLVDGNPAPGMSGAEQLGKPSIAILPFRNMGDAKEAEDYFADGITDEIIAALSRFHELSVIARGSSFAFKSRNLTNREVAGRLGARYVLDGSIRKSGSRIRISAELTHAASDAQIWSERYDRPLADVFDLQDDISASVAAAVTPAISGAEIQHARGRRPANLSAYDCYLRALPHLWAGTRDDVARAILLLRQSLSLDPTSTSTLTALAWGLVMAAPLGADLPSVTDAEAQGLARRAVELDATDAFAHSVYGFTLLGPGDEDEQGWLHAEQAIRLNPSSAFAWGTLGVIRSRAGDYDKAIACLDSALTLSPLDPMLHLWMTALAASNFALGRHEQGVVWARKSIRQNPGNGMGYRLLAANVAASGHVEEARTITSRRDAVQRTTLREIRAARYFKQAEVMDRYLAAQRMAGVAE
jgi:TolB-like protein/cytochrome c-type biogenesis protein CcmH/NrfG